MTRDRKLELAGREAYNIVKNQVMKAALGIPISKGYSETKSRVVLAAKLVKRLAEREGFTVKQVEAEAQRLSLRK